MHGRVQGVFFRAFVVNKAKESGLTGYVRNLPGGEDVEVLAEGDKEKLEQIAEQLKIGPPAARVDKIDIHWSKPKGEYSGFIIRY